MQCLKPGAPERKLLRRSFTNLESAVHVAAIDKIFIYLFIYHSWLGPWGWLLKSQGTFQPILGAMIFEIMQ